MVVLGTPFKIPLTLVNGCADYTAVQPAVRDHLLGQVHPEPCARGVFGTQQ